MGQNHYIKAPNDIKRFFRAFYHSAYGLKTAFHDSVAFRQAVYVSFVVIPLALFFGRSAFERAILIGSWLLVLLMEVINSAIEAAVDRISLEIHLLSKKIKDMASAAVLLAIINAMVIWGSIVIERLF